MSIQEKIHQELRDKLCKPLNNLGATEMVSASVLRDFADNLAATMAESVDVRLKGEPEANSPAMTGGPDGAAPYPGPETVEETSETPQNAESTPGPETVEKDNLTD